MEIKVLCHCGTKFKFDAEPVGGRMPMTVSCPSCGVDATEHANAFIKQSVAAAISASAAEVPSSAAVAHAAPPSVAAPQPKLRISGAGPAPAPPAAAEPAVGDLPPTAPPIRPFAQPAAARSPKPPGNFGLGLLGGLLGTIVGVALWLTIDNFFDMKVKFLMLAVGFCAGSGARLLGRDEGSQQLGLITATLVLVGIFGAQYWLAYQEMFGHDFEQSAAEDYKSELDEAKAALAAMPSESDDEIRQFLFKEWEESMKEEDEEMTEKITLGSISTNDIVEFRQERLPRMKGLVEGKITATDFQKEIDTNVDELKENSGIKLYLIVQGLNPLKIGLLNAALGLAYKMTANA